jgi:hypothetical protein
MKERTPEQRAADNELGEAIRKCALAYGMTEKVTITNYIVVMSGVEFDDNPKPQDCDFIVLEDNGERIADYQVIGMLRAALIRTERGYLYADDED